MHDPGHGNIRYYRYMLRKSLPVFGVGCFLILFALLTLSEKHNSSFLFYFMIFLAVAGAGQIVMGIHLFFTAYAVNKDGLVIRGIFKIRLIQWNMIADFELFPEKHSEGLVLYLKDGGRLEINYQLKGFYDFLNEMGEYYSPLREHDISKPRCMPTLEIGRRELTRSAMRQERKVAFIVVFGILAFYGYFFVFSPIASYRDYKSYRERAVTVDGTVFAYEDNINFPSLNIRYTDRNGKPVEFTYHGEYDFIGQNPIGAKLRIVYDPEGKHDTCLESKIRPDASMDILYISLPFFLLVFSLVCMEMAKKLDGNRRLYVFQVKIISDKCVINCSGIGALLTSVYQSAPDKFAGCPLAIFGKADYVSSYARTLNGRNIVFEKVTKDALVLDQENARLMLGQQAAQGSVLTYLVLPEAAATDPRQWFINAMDINGSVDGCSDDVKFFCAPRSFGPLSSEEFEMVLDKILLQQLDWISEEAGLEPVGSKEFKDIVGIKSYPENFVIAVSRDDRGLKVAYRNSNENAANFALLNNVGDYISKGEVPLYMSRKSWLSFPLMLILAPISVFYTFFTKRSFPVATLLECWQLRKLP